MSTNLDLFQPTDIETFISKVMMLQQHGMNCYKKFDNKYLIEYLDRSKIQTIQKAFNPNAKRMCLVDFVKFFLGIVQHQEIETLYLTMALIDTFKEISIKSKQKEISFLDLTNYLCETITEKNTNIKIPFKLFPIQKSQNPNLKSVREIDKKAPIIHQRVNLTLPKINQEKVKTDKTAHPSGPVSQVIFAKQMNKILALDTLSPSIKIFDTNLNFKSQLTPHQIGKNVKDMAILNFAYSQKQQRIGCIIKDIGMSFWEASDGFATEKKINKSKGQKIYYFELFEEWITTQKSYTQLWDIKQQKIKLTLDGIPGSNINSICQIPLLRVICVAYTGTEAQKQLILYQNFREITRMSLGHAGCHTLHYNKTTQTLIPIGYKISVSVYQIHPQYFDFTLVTQLKGHSSLVTCISDVDNTSLIVTGDDTGCIRVWDLRTLKCVQVVKVARWLSYLLYIPESKLIFTDSRINLINFEKIKGNIIQKQPVYPLNAIYSADTGMIIVATSKQIRMYNAKTGQLVQIYQVALQDELTFFSELGGQTYIAGTEQGKIKTYNSNGQTKNQLSAHSNEISFLKADTANKILVSASWDSNVHIWRQKQKGKSRGKQTPPIDQDVSLEPKSHSIVRTIKNNHFGKQVSILEISLHLNLIITGSVERKVFLWDFEYSKLLAEINLSAEPNCILFVNIYSLLIIGCSDGMTYIFKVNKKQAKLTIELIKYIIQSSDNTFQFQLFSTEVPSSSFSNLEILQNLDTEQRDKILTPSQFYLDMKQDGFSLCIGYSRGKLAFYSFDKISLQLEESFDQTTKHNYTPFRISTEDFNVEHSKNQYIKMNILQYLDSNKKHQSAPIWINQIHKQSIRSINIMQENERYLITSSTDGYFKIVSITTGQIICSMNINYALPIRWDLKLNVLLKAKQRVLLALKTIQMIFKKYQSTLTAHQGKSISLKKLLTRVDEICLFKKYKQPKPKIFADQYQPIDLNPTYPKVKSIPTLKELETYKRVYLNGSGFKRENNEDKIKTFKASNYERIEQRDQYEFLSPYYLPKIINKGKNNSPPSNDAYMKSLVAIFDNNRAQDDHSMIKKKNSGKVKIDFIEYAKGKQYLNQEGGNQNVGLSFSRILTNLNTKKQFSKRKQNKAKQSTDLTVSTLNTSISHIK